MPDPGVLYVVAAVVVSGLLAWVAVVLLRAPRAFPPPPASAGGPVAAHPDGTLPRTGGSDRPKLDSHAEIRDEPSAKLAREARAKSDEDG